MSKAILQRAPVLAKSLGVPEIGTAVSVRRKPWLIATFGKQFAEGGSL